MYIHHLLHLLHCASTYSNAQGRIDFPYPTRRHFLVPFKVRPRFFAFVRVSLAFRSSTLTNALYVPYVTQYFSVTTWATLVSLSSQMGGIVEFFLSKNIRIARDRAWDLTIISRGKSRDFWGPYVEEWQKPPKVNETSGLERIFGKWWARLLFRRCKVHLRFGWLRPNGIQLLVVLFPLNLYPFVGQAISAYLRAYGTSRYLHKKVSNSASPCKRQLSSCL